MNMIVSHTSFAYIASKSSIWFVDFNVHSNADFLFSWMLFWLIGEKDCKEKKIVVVRRLDFVSIPI